MDDRSNLKEMLLSRRALLRRGILTATGLAGLSGVELLRPLRARAQSVEPGRFYWLDLFQGGLSPNREGGLRASTYGYRYDYRFSGGATLPDIPPNLIATYRLSTGDFASLAGSRLFPDVKPAPFGDPSQPPPNPYPDPPPVGQLLRVNCYRILQRMDGETVRIFDWCTLYCAFGDLIVITDGHQLLSYVEGAPTVAGPHISGDHSPTPGPGWKSIAPEAYFPAIGNPGETAFYYQSPNKAPGQGTSATWRTGVGTVGGNGGKLLVAAYIPGTSDRAGRTKEALYTIEHAGLEIEAKVKIDQQVDGSQWKTLGEFPFRAGPFKVTLTNETPTEDPGTRFVVANAICWSASGLGPCGTP